MFVVSCRRPVHVVSERRRQSRGLRRWSAPLSVSSGLGLGLHTSHSRHRACDRTRQAALNEPASQTFSAIPKKPPSIVLSSRDETHRNHHLHHQRVYADESASNCNGFLPATLSLRAFYPDQQRKRKSNTTVRRPRLTKCKSAV